MPSPCWGASGGEAHGPFCSPNSPKAEGQWGTDQVSRTQPPGCVSHYPNVTPLYQPSRPYLGGPGSLPQFYPFGSSSRIRSGDETSFLPHPPPPTPTLGQVPALDSAQAARPGSLPVSKGPLTLEILRPHPSCPPTACWKAAPRPLGFPDNCPSACPPPRVLLYVPLAAPPTPARDPSLGKRGCPHPATNPNGKYFVTK